MSAIAGKEIFKGWLLPFREFPTKATSSRINEPSTGEFAENISLTRTSLMGR
jgi:hypothetical protein